MSTVRSNWSARAIPALLAGAALALAACAGAPSAPTLKDTGMAPGPNYIIGPGDTVNVFVWRNPELSATVPVRPDGKITTPLVEDLQASGKTPTQLARDMEQALSKYIKNPIVTVIVTGFVGRYSEQVRVVGEAAKPQALPYKEGMTLLDVMIAVGGLTEYAAGNRARLVRMVDGKQQVYTVRLEDLVRRGDVSANVRILPGDVLIIPEAFF